MQWIGLFIFELIILFFLSRGLAQSLAFFFFRITKSKNSTIQLLSLLFLPGVIVHELAHLITAGILFVPVGDIEFVPKLQNDGTVKLGSVAIAKTDPLRRAVIGFAPVFAGLTIIFTTFYYSPPLLATYYILFEVSNTMFSSRKDAEGAVELLATIAVLIFLLYLIGVRFDPSVIRQFFPFDLTPFLKKADLFFLVPIVIDILAVGLIRVIND